MYNFLLRLTIANASKLMTNYSTHKASLIPAAACTV